MADASVAGSAVVNGRLLLKRRGNWTLYAYDLAGDTPPSGQVVCEWLGTQLLGHVLRSGLADGAVDAVITGGRTEHSKRLSAAMYDYQVPVALVLQGIIFVVLLASETLHGRFAIFRPKSEVERT